MADTKDYTVAIEGFMLGDFRKKGSTIALNERQAREFVREGRIIGKAAKALVKADDVKPADSKPKG